MSELIAKVLTGVLRVVMAPILTWLINKQIISSNESVNLVAEIFAYLVPIGWTVWAWINAHRATVTALAMQKGSTMLDLKDSINNGETASVTTPTNMAPHIVKTVVAFMAVILLAGSMSACASTDQFNKLSANLTHDAIVSSEQHRCSSHPAPCLGADQFKAVNVALATISDAGVAYTKLRIAGTATPADAAAFFNVLVSVTSMLSHDYPTGAVGGVLAKLVALEAKLSQFIQ